MGSLEGARRKLDQIILCTCKKKKPQRMNTFKRKTVVLLYANVYNAALGSVLPSTTY